MITRTITYNGVTFPYTRLQVQENPVYADDGATQIGTDYYFTISGYLVGTSLADYQSKLSDMRGALQMPRAPFTIQMSSGGPAATLYEFGAGHDDDWGPIPGPLRFSQHANISCRYDWTVKCHRKEKWSGNNVLDSDVVLSLVRRYQFAVDVNGLTTRTISGVLTVSSRGAPADQYRALVAPEGPAWFERRSQNFEQSADTRQLTFSVTDQEVVWTLPAGVTQGECSFHVRLDNCAIVTYQLSGYFCAPIDVWKPALIEQVRNLIDQRIPPGAFFDSIDFTDEVYGNRISFSVQARAGGTFNPANAGGIVGIEALSGFGQRPPGSTGSATMAGSYGGHGAENSGVSAGEMVLYDAAGNPTASAPTNETPPPGAGATVESGPRNDGTWEPVEGDEGISDEQKASPYIHYCEVVSYEIDNGIKVFRSKADDGNPIVQRAYAPVTTIIQAGTATRLARSAAYLPVPPKPIYDKEYVTMMHSYISPAAGEVINADFSRYTITWRFVMVSKTLPSDGGSWNVPSTPVRPEEAENWQIDAPEGLVVEALP